MSIEESMGRYSPGALEDAIEAKIEATLPAIAGLVPELGQRERLAVLAASVAVSRAAFIAANGDPFDCEDPTATVAVRSAMPLERAAVAFQGT